MFLPTLVGPTLTANPGAIIAKRHPLTHTDKTDQCTSEEDEPGDPFSKKTTSIERERAPYRGTCSPFKVP